jgi:ubiquinone/menaquinone biosynthesis C-methylase UbiE
MRVTGVDQDANAVIFAERAAAAPELKGQLKVRQANACRLPFEDGSYRVVVAFDCLGHARAPERILAEMFRVRSRDGIVLITEYNTEGRRATRHRNFGFEERLAGLLQAHCAGCRRIEHPHHVTYVCDATARHGHTSPGRAVERVPMAITN